MSSNSKFGYKMSKEEHRNIKHIQSSAEVRALWEGRRGEGSGQGGAR